jgi:hypothetical protein
MPYAGEQIMALDISKRSTGVCEGKLGEKPIFYTVPFGDADHDPEDTWYRCFDWFLDRLLAPAAPSHVFIEAPAQAGSFSGHTNANVTTTVTGLWSTVSSLCRKRGVIFRKVHVATARKSFLGIGNLKSADAKREVRRVCDSIGWKPKNFDEADAGCVFHFAGKQIAPSLMPDTRPFFADREKIPIFRKASDQ